MVASTDIKFYVHSNNNAPQLQNAYGSMIGVLDACLVNGLSVGPVSTLTVVGTTVTAVFSTAHNLMQYQVLKIAGANQAEYNGEHRILTVPNATSVTFQLASPPSATTATGTISASLPPLGWEKPFSNANVNGGGKAAYRSKNLLLPSRPFLRVVDELDSAYTATYAKYAKVGIVEDMTDINTMLGVQAPYDSASPDKNWVGTGGGSTAVNGWAKWYYATTTDWSDTRNFNEANPPVEGARDYVIIGSNDFFYVCPGSVPLNQNIGLYGFGSLNRFDQADLCANYLLATINYNPASFGRNKALLTCSSIRIGVIKNSLCQRAYNGAEVFEWCALSSIQNFNGDFRSGAINYFQAPGGTNNIIPLSPVIFSDIIPRGEMPSLKWLQTFRPVSHLATKVYKGRMSIFVNQGAGSGLSGQVAFDLGEV